MNAEQWQSCTDPARMLAWLTNAGAGGSSVADLGQRLMSDRQLRLFACAVCRVLCVDDARLRDVGIAERWADGRSYSGPFLWDLLLPEASRTALHVCAERWGTAIGCGRLTPADKAALLRDIVGNPFDPVTLPCVLVPCPDCVPGQPDVNCDDCSGLGTVYDPCPWLTSTVFAIATTCYDDRRPDGSLDDDALCVLADALEEAGCEEGECNDCRGYGGRWWCRQCRGGWLAPRDCDPDDPQQCWSCSREAGEIVPVTWKDCEVCHGTGRVPHSLLANLRRRTWERACEACGGSGQVATDLDRWPNICVSCGTCHGSGRESVARQRFRGYHCLDVVLGKT